MSPYPTDLMLPGGALEPGGLLDQMLGIEAPQLDKTAETLPRLKLLQRILQGYAGFEPGIQPRGFGEGLVAGIGRGLGRAGERSIMERAAMERGIAERQRARDQANLEATRTYRQQRGLTLREYNREQARLAEKEADYRRKNPPPGTPEYAARMKQREEEARATEAGRQAARPTGEPLVVVHTASGDVYMRRSEAAGKTPGRNPRSGTGQNAEVKFRDGTTAVVPTSSTLFRNFKTTGFADSSRVAPRTTAGVARDHDTMVRSITEALNQVAKNDSLAFRSIQERLAGMPPTVGLDPSVRKLYQRMKKRAGLAK